MAALQSICALILISKIFQSGECQIIHQAVFRKEQQKYLANHVIDTKHAHTESECYIYCVRDKSCVSVNFKTSGTGEGLCELNSKTLQEISYADESKHNAEFNHLYKVEKKQADPSQSCPKLQATTQSPKSGQCKEGALGMENMNISDFQIKASTNWSDTYPARKARLKGPGAWRAKYENDPWIEVDLRRNEIISVIATQGQSGSNEWVKIFTVSYSSDGKNFDFHKINGIIREFSGNYDQNSIVRNPLSPAVTARYIRLHPKTWYRNAAMRFELYGCTVNTIPCKAGEKTLGVEDNKKVKDSQLTSSSYWSTNHSAAYGRLYNYTGSWGWKAGVDNKKQWIQVDLGKKEVVTGISTQGGRYYQNYYRYCRVKSYSLKHSLNGTMFESYKDGGVVKISVGNNDYRTIVKNVLSPPITARYIRIHPVSWDRNICMRIELYGCY
ncbi:lactadherin-like [Dendronephthya gigantea]|uniref:lactadherin-like n=1 Tax=Dendronephthya gigantea TaxID=151771 RepID=UPI0010698CA1|nr:lactadherin-like [Dendronephthya gigantea]